MQTLTALELGEHIETGSCDPVELAQGLLSDIGSHEFGDRIYARLTPDRALAEARAAQDRAKRGMRLGPLDGVPISWKDLFDTAGCATEAGSALLQGRTPSQDAQVLTNATLGGSVCLGKTHMSELAFSGLGLNPVTQTPPCVNDHAAVSGGSSSGAAASVAFGLAPAAIGSDTGGSVRIPAAWNDLVGFKTTAGVVSVQGVVPLCAKFDTVGPLTQTVADAAAVFALIQGTRCVDLTPPDPTSLHLAILETVALDDLRAEPAAAFTDTVAKLERAGVTITRIQAPEVAQAMDLAGVLYAPEAYATWRDAIEAQPDLMFDKILERFRGGAGVTATDYIAGCQQLDKLRQRYHARVAGFDAVILPSAPILPPNTQRLMSDDTYYVSENLLALRNTRIGNLMGSCALTLPTGHPSCGLMVQCAPGRDERLLRMGLSIERAMQG